MSVEIGHFALVLAVAMSAAQAVLPAIGVVSGHDNLRATARTVPLFVCGCMLISFAVLVAAYARSDFSVLSVFLNSHTHMPLLFKITASWGNHEGSMLLFLVILALFGALAARFPSRLEARLRALAISVQGALLAALGGFVVFTSNPFLRLAPAPPQGADLNPVLQDIGLAVHPPLLYVGYVGFSLTFSFAVAALLCGRVDREWARAVRPFALVAWAFLTLGIALGSYWAYYELGWGGWWFWDPVENASLMPWLTGTALVHSVRVLERRDALKSWTVLLAILTFSLSLIGTFLVRSGILTSIHSFASDPERGMYLLALIALVVAGALALYTARAGRLEAGGFFEPVSREGALVANNFLLTCACAIVFTGTLYPLALEFVTGTQISVGPPFFNLVLMPVLFAGLAAMPAGQHLGWVRGQRGRLVRVLAPVALLSVAAGLAFLLMMWPDHMLAALLLMAAIWVAGGALRALSVPLLRLAALRRPGIPAPPRPARPLAGHFAVFCGHSGFAVCMAGMVLASFLAREDIVRVIPGEVVEIAGYELVYEGVSDSRHGNYARSEARFALRHAGVVIGHIRPARHYYPARDSVTTEAGIHRVGFSHLFLTIGPIGADNAVDLRAAFKPAVTLIWLGALVMALGGLMAILARPRPVILTGVDMKKRR